MAAGVLMPAQATIIPRLLIVEKPEFCHYLRQGTGQPPWPEKVTAAEQGDIITEHRAREMEPDDDQIHARLDHGAGVQQGRNRSRGDHGSAQPKPGNGTCAALVKPAKQSRPMGSVNRSALRRRGVPAKTRADPGRESEPGRNKGHAAKYVHPQGAGRVLDCDVRAVMLMA